MATDRLHIQVSIQKLWGLFADNGKPSNKNKLPMISLVLVASMAIGIFVVNIIKLVNSDTPVKTAPITQRQEVVSIERTGIESWEEVPIAKKGAGPLHKAHETAPVETLPVEAAPQTVPTEAIRIQPAPTSPVKKKPASPAPKVESPERFTIDNHLYRAREYEIKGEYSMALARYQKVINKDKDNFIVLNNIAYIYLQLDLLKESIEYSIRAINVNRDYVPALTNVGIAYAKNGDLSSAEYHLSRAIKLAPADQNLILNMALLHERQDRLPEASDHYLKLAKLGKVSGALGLARVYEKEGRTAEAVKYYRNIYNSSSIDSKTRAFVRQRAFILQNNPIKNKK